jgi:hypothetical protein
MTTHVAPDLDLDLAIEDLEAQLVPEFWDGVAKGFIAGLGVGASIGIAVLVTT